MTITPRSPLSDAMVSGLQSTLKVTLPQDYLSFLKETNGGAADTQTFAVEDVGEVMCDCLFGLGVPEENDLVSVNEEYADDVPDGMLLIGDDPGGAFYLLDATDGGKVYFYDHQYRCPESSDEGNTYYICDNFSAFLQLLGGTKQ